MTSSAPRRPSFTPTPRYASTKAAAFWASLRADLVALVAEAAELSIDPEVTVPADAAELLAEDCSQEIDMMLDDIRTLRYTLRTARRMAARADRSTTATALVEDRLYEVDGEIYRTVMSGQGNLYAKIWTDEGWEYAAGAIRHIRPEHRMTVERAKELSIRFGRCVRCRRVLTAEESVERGIGPVCITLI